MRKVLQVQQERQVNMQEAGVGSDKLNDALQVSHSFIHNSMSIFIECLFCRSLASLQLSSGDRHSPGRFPPVTLSLIHI